MNITENILGRSSPGGRLGRSRHRFRLRPGAFTDKSHGKYGEIMGDYS